MRDYISRMVLKRVRRIDTVQDLQTKDGRKVRVKGIAIISKKVKSTMEKIIRSQISETMKMEVSESDFDDFVMMLTTDELKSKILREARKIYPVRNFEIRKSEVL